MAETSTKKGGRPAGSANRDYAVVVVNKSACPACGSVERSDYTDTSTMDFNGIDQNGMSYSKVTWRTCQCLACGQWRKDKSFE